jgi:hypothetical protein
MHSHAPGIQTNKETDTDNKMCACSVFVTKESLQFKPAYSLLCSCDAV